MDTVLASARLDLDGFAAVQEEFHRRGWTDGLPVIPPTPDLVRAFLAAAGLPPDDVIGELPERSRTITAEKLAVNAVMAGCLPEHFPVVVAAWRCMLAPEWNPNSGVVSTSGPAPLLIVNGPVSQRLGLRSGANLFGPGNRANASIGRSIRLGLINLAGAEGDMDPACTGHPGRFCYCIAEDEDDIWDPLHVQRGFERGQSAVTVVNLEAPQHVRDDSAASPERLLSNYADHARSWNQPGAAVAIFNPEHRAVVQQAGWSKVDVSGFLHDASVRTVASLKAANKLRGPVAEGDEAVEFRWSRGPEDFLVVGAGGYGAFSAIIPPWAGAVYSSPVTREVPAA